MTTSRQILWPLRYIADLRTLMFLVVFNVLLAVQWLIIARGMGFAILTYTLAVVALVVKHNHMHSPTFRGPAWNSAFEFWLSVLTAHPCSGIITSHNASLLMGPFYCSSCWIGAPR